MSNLFRQMERAMGFSELYQHDFEIDKCTLQKRYVYSKEYYWILGKDGTDLRSAPQIFMKDSYANFCAFMHLDNGKTKVYKITLTSNDERGVDGELQLVENFKEILLKNTACATEITGRFVSFDGIIAIVTVEYEEDYYEALIEALGWSGKDVREYYLTDIKF